MMPKDPHACAKRNSRRLEFAVLALVVVVTLLVAAFGD